MIYREEAVKIMSDTIEAFNRKVGEQSGVSSEDVEKIIQDSRDQLIYMNGLIYDALKDNGVIA